MDVTESKRQAVGFGEYGRHRRAWSAVTDTWQRVRFQGFWRELFRTLVRHWSAGADCSALSVFGRMMLKP